jgi:hypothetical protein
MICGTRCIEIMPDNRRHRGVIGGEVEKGKKRPL